MTNNQLTFIALANEYCALVENAPQSTPAAFTNEAVRLLPRLYITADGLLRTIREAGEDVEAYIPAALDEDYYNSVRLGIETLYGPDDTFLEVFEQDMKYSDTPIGASIAEHLADIFQEMYNFLEGVRDAPDELAGEFFAAVTDDFEQFWSQRLVNVMRPLNALHFSLTEEE